MKVRVACSCGWFGEGRDTDEGGHEEWQEHAMQAHGGTGGTTA